MNSKYEKINENDYNFSHVGNASAKKYLYIYYILYSKYIH